jgi:6-phosphogluconolactonase
MNERPPPKLEVFADRDALAEAASGLIAERLERALRLRGRAAFLATGGSTPAETYRRLREAPIDWSKVAVGLTDERWVPPTSPDSNERMLRETLLAGPAARARFVPLWSQAQGPEAAARTAEPDIRALGPADVVLLGMGEDGHIASLFPGSPALEAGLDPGGRRLCIGVPDGVPAPPQARISLTLPALLNGLVLILISGEAKRRTLEAALQGADLPVRRVLAQPRVPVRILWSP